MVKVRGRPSRASIQPPPESSYLSESENDTFMTAKSAQQTFMSVESTFTAANSAIDDTAECDDTIQEPGATEPLANITATLSNRTLRSTTKSSQLSKSVLDVNKTPARCLRSNHSMRVNSAPGIVSKDNKLRRKLSETTEYPGKSRVQRLQSTPTDNAAAKRKAAESEPAHKILMYGSMMNLSPIEPVPSGQRIKSRRDSSPKKHNEETEKLSANNNGDTVCLSDAKSQNDAYEEPQTSSKLPVVSGPQTVGARSNIATSLEAFGHKPKALSRPSPTRKRPLKPKLTLPTSPKFATTTRVNNRPIDYEPYSEREKKIADEIKKYRFRAQPIPKNVLKVPPPPGPAKVQKLAPSASLQSKPNQQSKASVASSLPNNTKKMLGVAGGGVQKKRSTETRTPTFTLADRIKQKSEREKRMVEAHRARQAVKEQIEKGKHGKAGKAALKGPGVPQKKLDGEKITRPAPFSFDAHDRLRKAAKERKIEEIYEEEKRQREFKAHPLPNLKSITGLPQKEFRPATRPEPFNLATEDRNLAANTTWSTTVDSVELPVDDDQYVFKARPMPDLSVPFIPEKSQRGPTAPLPIVLNTALRAEERKPYEEYLKAREQELEEAQHQREIELEEEDRRERVRIRESMAFVAHPVRHYKPTVIEHHRIAPTVPESPLFATRTRAQHRAAAQALAALQEEQDHHDCFNDSTDTYVLEHH